VVSLEAGVLRDLAGDPALTELRRAVRSRQARVWVDVCEPAPGLLAEVCEILELHPLLAEDLAERDQRAKLDQIGELLHLVVFSLGFDGGQNYDRELDFVFGKRILLSSHSHWWDPRATHHIRVGLAEALRRGPDYVLWALCDDTIDAYFPILDRLGDEIDALEDEVVARADRALLERLFELKRALIQVRRITAREREMFNILSSREETPISADNRLYFRDAYDHLIRRTGELDTYRELASAALETYLSTVNNNLSLIMKRLTGVTVVVAGIGAVAGIFGMSEAQSAFRADEGPGFWIITFGSMVLAAIAVAVLRKVDWI
jgi:magnesium transporter